MLQRQRLAACPECGCHVQTGTTDCPHCGWVIELRRGRPQPTRVAVIMGLGAAATLGSTAGACGESGEDAWGFPSGEGAFDSGAEAAVSTYGAGPSGGYSTGYGTTGGPTGPGASGSGSTSTGIEPECMQFGDATECAVCLSDNCCAEGEACVDECVTAMSCLDACDASDLECAAACQRESPDGFALYQALYQCGINVGCDVSCLPP